MLRMKNYYGVNFNIEYVYPYDRDSYSQFLRRAADELHPRGYFLSTAIAPKESAEQEGLLYTAHDYAAHGRYRRGKFSWAFQTTATRGGCHGGRATRRRSSQTRRR